MQLIPGEKYSSKGENVRILVGEPEANLRHGLRSALQREGYDWILDFDKLDALKDAIQKQDADLILMDSEMDVGAADELITDLRNNRIGKNPFVPVIVTIWHPTREMVTRVASSGTDDMLVKPVSPAQVFDRINVLVNNRRPFVVTADYIGPDRRKDPERKSEIPTIEVPNTLRAKVKGEPLNQESLSDLIAQAQAEINDQRLKRNAFQVGFLIHLLLPELQSYEVTEERIKTVERLMVVARDTGIRVKGTKYDHVTSLCTALTRVASSIYDTINAPDKKDVDLLKPLSEAILAAFNPDSATAELASQISNAVSSYKKRMNG